MILLVKIQADCRWIVSMYLVTGSSQNDRYESLDKTSIFRRLQFICAILKRTTHTRSCTHICDVCQMYRAYMCMCHYIAQDVSVRSRNSNGGCRCSLDMPFCMVHLCTSWFHKINHKSWMWYRMLVVVHRESMAFGDEGTRVMGHIHSWQHQVSTSAMEASGAWQPEKSLGITSWRCPRALATMVWRLHCIWNTSLTCILQRNDGKTMFTSRTYRKLNKFARYWSPIFTLKRSHAAAMKCSRG